MVCVTVAFISKLVTTCLHIFTFILLEKHVACVYVPSSHTCVFSFQGKLNTYRFCDNVWTFVLNNVDFRDVQELAKCDKVKIVACDGKSKYTKSKWCQYERSIDSVKTQWTNPYFEIFLFAMLSNIWLAAGL